MLYILHLHTGQLLLVAVQGTVLCWFLLLKQSCERKSSAVRTALFIRFVDRLTGFAAQLSLLVV